MAAVNISLWVVHRSVLVSEAAWWVSLGFLRAHTHVVKFSLLGSHIAAIAIEGTHGGLGATVQHRSGGS